MEKKPVLSINITEKTFCLCMLAAQQLLDTINSKKSLGLLSNVALKPKKSPLKFISKTSRWNRY